MKISFLLSALVLATSAFADTDTDLARLKELVQKSAGSKPVCDDYKKATEEVIQGVSPATALKEKAAAVRLLGLVQQYPGTPSETRAVYSKVGEISRAGKLSEAVIQIETGAYTCELQSYFEGMRVLIASVKALDFSADERREVANVVLGRIKQDIGSDAPLIEVLFHGQLLSALIDAKLIEAGPTTLSGLSQWKKELASVQSRLKKVTAKNPKSVERISLEFQLVREPATKLIQLAKSLKT